MSNYPGALSGGFISHRFQSLKPDQPDLSLVNPTQWNQSHIIGSGAIQSGALGASAVNSGNLAANSVTSGVYVIGSGAIQSGALGANSVTSGNFASNSVVSGIVASGAIPWKPFVTIHQSGPAFGGDFGPGTVGTTTAGIQEAINSLTSGGMIFITPGQYVISSQVNVSGPITLKGSNFGATVLGPASLVNGFAATSGMISLGTGSILEDLRINGQGSTYTSGIGITISTGSDQRISRCVVISFASNCVLITNSGAGLRMVIDHSVLQSANPNTVYAIQLAPTELNGDRMITNCYSFGALFLDLNGSATTLVQGCDFVLPINFTATSKKAAFIGNRLAIGGANPSFTITGSDHLFVGNVCAGGVWTIDGVSGNYIGIIGNRISNNQAPINNSPNSFIAYNVFDSGTTPTLLPPSGITAGVSPWTFTNTNNFPVVMAFQSGSVSSIALVRGVTNIPIATSTPATVFLNVGDATKVTYTSAPTTTMFPQG